MTDLDRHPTHAATTKPTLLGVERTVAVIGLALGGVGLALFGSGVVFSIRPLALFGVGVLATTFLMSFFVGGTEFEPDDN